MSIDFILSAIKLFLDWSCLDHFGSVQLGKHFVSTHSVIVNIQFRTIFYFKIFILHIRPKYPKISNLIYLIPLPRLLWLLSDVFPWCFPCSPVILCVFLASPQFSVISYRLPVCAFSTYIPFWNLFPFSYLVWYFFQVSFCLFTPTSESAKVVSIPKHATIQWTLTQKRLWKNWDLGSPQRLCCSDPKHFSRSTRYSPSQQLPSSQASLQQQQLRSPKSPVGTATDSQLKQGECSSG